jgi:RNA polymerase sigma-70 factor (ECF subfamily)
MDSVTGTREDGLAAALFEKYPDRERHAFLLCEVGGLSYEELADVLDTSVAAVRSLLYRVRLQLRTSVLPPSGIEASHLVWTRTEDHDV